MAALTMQAVINADRSITVTRSTDDAIGAAEAALIFDNTLVDKTAVMAAYAALGRALRREFSKVDNPTDFPTSGSSVE